MGVRSHPLSHPYYLNYYVPHTPILALDEYITYFSSELKYKTALASAPSHTPLATISLQQYNNHANCYIARIQQILILFTTKYKITSAPSPLTKKHSSATIPQPTALHLPTYTKITTQYNWSLWITDVINLITYINTQLTYGINALNTILTQRIIQCADCHDINRDPTTINSVYPISCNTCITVQWQLIECNHIALLLENAINQLQYYKDTDYNTTCDITAKYSRYQIISNYLSVMRRKIPFSNNMMTRNRLQQISTLIEQIQECVGLFNSEYLELIDAAGLQRDKTQYATEIRNVTCARGAIQQHYKDIEKSKKEIAALQIELQQQKDALILEKRTMRDNYKQLQQDKLQLQSDTIELLREQHKFDNDKLQYHITACTVSAASLSNNDDKRARHTHKWWRVICCCCAN
jgi:hypothetical protein